mgnify:CR=1 FL=1
MKPSQLSKNEKELKQVTDQFKQNLQKIVEYFSEKLKIFVQRLQSQYYQYTNQHFLP